MWASSTSTYQSIQADSARKILDVCPSLHKIRLFPLPSCTKASGHFMDTLRRHEHVCDLTLERCELESAGDRFAEEMSLIHDNEDQRKMSDLRALNRILTLGGRNVLMTASVDRQEKSHLLTRC